MKTIGPGWTSEGGRVIGSRSDEQRRQPGQRRRADPDERKATDAVQGLAEQRAERDAQVQRQRVEAERLALAATRREVREHRESGHEEERLRHAEDQAQDDEHHQVGDDEVRQDGRGRERRSGDQQRTPSSSIRLAPAPRPKHERRDAECADRDADANRIGTQRTARKERSGQDQHPR